MDIERRKIDCLRFVMCPLLVLGFQGFFFMWPLIVLMKQTRQAGCTIKQFILLRCLWCNPGQPKCRTYTLGLGLHGCMAAWLHGCMAEWLHGWMAAWLNGCMAACLIGVYLTGEINWISLSSIKSSFCSCVGWQAEYLASVGAKTISTTTFSITTLCIIVKNVTLSITIWWAVIR